MNNEIEVRMKSSEDKNEFDTDMFVAKLKEVDNLNFEDLLYVD